MNRDDEVSLTAPFSDRYVIVQDAEVMTRPDGYAEMDAVMHRRLSERFGEYFVGMVGGIHYQFQPSRTVPAGAVVVPASNHDNAETMLILNE